MKRCCRNLLEMNRFITVGQEEGAPAKLTELELSARLQHNLRP